VVALAAGAKRCVNQESGMDHLKILPISKAPVRKGEVDLRPALVAPTSRGGWALAGWNGSAWFELYSGRVLDPQIYVALPRLRVGSP
jgi:hypothetical protein